MLIFYISATATYILCRCKDTSICESSTKKQALHTKAKDSAVDLLDELFDDPNAVIKTGSSPRESHKTSKEATAVEMVSDSKSIKDSAKTGDDPTSGGLAMDTNSPPDSSDVKNDATVRSKIKKESTVVSDVKMMDTVKSKVKKDDSCDSSKSGSTDKPRRLPDWLASVSSSSNTGGGASRKRKAPSKTSSTVAKKKKSDDDEKDSDTLSSPPPPKKVKVRMYMFAVSVVWPLSFYKLHNYPVLVGGYLHRSFILL